MAMKKAVSLIVLVVATKPEPSLGVHQYPDPLSTILLSEEFVDNNEACNCRDYGQVCIPYIDGCCSPYHCLYPGTTCVKLQASSFKLPILAWWSSSISFASITYFCLNAVYPYSSGCRGALLLLAKCTSILYLFHVLRVLMNLNNTPLHLSTWKLYYR